MRRRSRSGSGASDPFVLRVLAVLRARRLSRVASIGTGDEGVVDVGRPDQHFLKHLRGESLESTFAMGEVVQDLILHPGWSHVMALLGAEIGEIDRRLDGFQEPLSQAQYAMAHGRRAGLRGARLAAEAILHRYRTQLEEQRRKHEGEEG